MMLVTFDTHKFVERLVATGFTKQQAEILSDEHQKFLEAHLANVASKQDIGLLKQDIERLELKLGYTEERLDTKIDNLEVKLETKIDNLEGRLETKIDNLEIKLETTVDNLEIKLETTVDSLERRIDGVEQKLEKHIDTKIEGVRGEIRILMWMLGILCGIIVALRFF